MNLKYDVLIIDTNNFYARAFDVCKKSTKGISIINQTIQLTFEMILKLKREFLDDNGIIYCLADNPTSKIKVRKQLDSSYKSSRPKESDGYYRGIDYLLLIAQKYSSQFKTLRIKRLEADDLVPKIISLNPDKFILLCSSDLDWARCMSDKSDWYNFSKVYTNKIFYDEYKFYPNEKTVTLMKVLLGDKSDEIPAIKGINYQTMLNIVDNFDDIFEVIDCVLNHKEKSKLLSEFTKTTILHNKERLITNHNLVYFCEIDNDEIKQTIIDGDFNEQALTTLYSALDFPENFDKRIKTRSKKLSFGFEDIPRK